MHIETGYLYTKPDGTHEFVHDPDREFFAGRHYANQINIDKKRIDDLFNKMWTFKIKEEFWGVNGRSINRTAYNELRFMSGLLDMDNAQRFADRLTSSYFSFKKEQPEHRVNPFVNDFIFFCDVADLLGIEDKMLRKQAALAISDDYSNHMETNDRLIQGLCRLGSDVVERALDDPIIQKRVSEILCTINPSIMIDRYVSRLIGYSISGDTAYSSFFDLADMYNQMSHHLKPISMEKLRKIILKDKSLTEINEKIESRCQKPSIPTRKIANRYPQKGYQRKEIAYYERLDPAADWNHAGISFYRDIFNPLNWIHDPLEHLKSSDGKKRLDAVYSIVNYKMLEAEQVCLDLIAEGDVKQKLYSLFILKEIGSERSVPQLNELIDRVILWKDQKGAKSALDMTAESRIKYHILDLCYDAIYSILERMPCQD